MASKRTYALIAAQDVYESELDGSLEGNGDAYVEDNGPRSAPFKRYEAGIVRTMSIFRSKQSCEYGDTWDELISALKGRPARLRRIAARAWAEAAFDALVAGAAPPVVAEQAMQLRNWIDNGSTVEVGP